jgi:hypothetical protein
MEQKGRAVKVGLRGELNPRAKLSDTQIAEIRNAFRPFSPGLAAALAREYGVSRSTIRGIGSRHLRSVVEGAA